MTPTDLYHDPSKINWGLPIVIDFETYYDKDYSLSKITTEKYIRCNQFEMIGVSIKVGSNPSEFYRREEGLPYIKELVQTHENSPFLSHNSTFDQGILGLRYNIHPLFTVDTVIMAKLSALDRVAGGKSLAKLSGWMQAQGLVPEQKRDTVHNMLGVHAADMTEAQWQAYGDYCKLDSDLCYALYSYMLPMCQVDELMMSDITTKMWTRPAFDLDVPLLQDYAKRLEAERVEKLSVLADKMGFTDVDELHKHLRSSAKFVALLARLGIDCPMKWSEKQAKMIPAVSKTDLPLLELLEHDDELVRLLVETKLGSQSSMEATRTQTFLDMASRGRMPVLLTYAGAHTGRYAAGVGAAANVQNLAKRTKDPVLRRSMRAPAGCVVLATDSGQIELRMNSVLSNQQDLIRVFQNNLDPYVDMASAIYGKTYDEIYHISKVEPTKEGKTMRNMGKMVSLACGFSMSAATFRSRMQLEKNHEAAEMADELVQAFRTKNNMITQFWKTCNRALDVMYAGQQMWFGGADDRMLFADGQSKFNGVVIPSIMLPNGTRIWYQNLRKEAYDDGRMGYVYDQLRGKGFIPKRVFGGAICENVVQATAFAALKWQALEIAKAGVPIHLNVHDEWVSVVSARDAAAAAIIHCRAMKTSPPWFPQGVLDCEVDVGRNYGILATIHPEKYL